MMIQYRKYDDWIDMKFRGASIEGRPMQDEHFRWSPQLMFDNFPEIRKIYFWIEEIIEYYDGKISFKDLIKILRGKSSNYRGGGGYPIFVLNGDYSYDCKSGVPLIAPMITPEYTLKVLNIAAMCLHKGHPIKSVILLTNKLDAKIEYYTDMVFDTLGHLKVRYCARWYIKLP